MEPFGSLVEDIRAGIIAAMIVNVNQGADGEPLGALDFFPWHKPPVQPAVVAPKLAIETEQDFLRRSVYALAVK